MRPISGPSLRFVGGSCALLAALLGAAAPSGAQSARSSSAPTDSTVQIDQESLGAAVVVRGDTVLFVPTRYGAFSAADRAEAIEERVLGLWRSPPDSLALVPAESATDIVAGELVVMTVTDADAAARGTARDVLAEEFRLALWEEIGRVSLQSTLRAIGFGLLRTLVATLVMLAIVWLLRRGFRRLEAVVERHRGAIPSVRIKTLELLSASVLASAIDGAVRMLRILLFVLLFYFYIPLVLTFFPWTAKYADRLLDYVLKPIIAVLSSVGGYLPNILFIAVIVAVTRYVLRAVKLVFDALGRGTLTLGGFEQDWAEPTYKIARFLIGAFALVVVFPYLPGADSEAFKGVSLFLGALISFGSTSAIANAVAGVVLTYTRAFKVGDRIAIADTIGDVTARTLLVTRIRTIKQVEVTIPNAMVLSAHVHNYTTMARSVGLILHTGVTIGYDVPWRQVHELLIAAAKATPGIKEEPAPFVLQTSLDDFYVAYQINAYTAEPAKMALTYSALHANIQDRFNEAGVEIMSPHYAALRDGNTVTIPGSATADAPAFRVQRIDRT